MSTQPPTTVIVGAGLSGLATAFNLKRQGAPVTVLERAGRHGGVIETGRTDGFLWEAGPSSMLLKARAVEDFLDAIGVAPHITEANPDATKRFLVRNGQVLALPTSPLQAIRTPLWTWPAKLRLLAEPFIPRTRLADESVASFVTRRMGHEFLDYGIAALVSGIYAGNPRNLSIRHAFGKVWNLEQRWGSLIRGAVGLKRERRRRGETPYKSRLLSFAGGLATLGDALAGHLGGNLRLGATITAIDQAAGGWRIGWRDADGEHTERCDRLVLTMQLPDLAALPLPPALRAAWERVPQPEYVAVSTVALGFPRAAVAHPLDGFGMLIPFAEQRSILGAIFASTLFPGRAPDGCVQLMIFAGGAVHPEIATLPEAELVPLVLRDLGDLLGVSGKPVFQRHTFWPRAIPQYNVGHGLFLEALEQVESAFPGLHLRGNFRGGVGINDVLAQALAFGAP
jgi:oxygen-dependent protoporphyrinogen oxidase